MALVNESLQGFPFLRARGAGQESTEEGGYGILLLQVNLLARGPGKLEEHFVVEQGERLQRRVAAVALGQAVLARGSVEGHEPGKRGGALDESIDRAPVTVFPLGCIPALVPEGMSQHGERLRGVDPGAKHLG